MTGTIPLEAEAYGLWVTHNILVQGGILQKVTATNMPHPPFVAENEPNGIPDVEARAGITEGDVIRIHTRKQYSGSKLRTGVID